MVETVGNRREVPTGYISWFWGFSWGKKPMDVFLDVHGGFPLRGHEIAEGRNRYQYNPGFHAK